MLDKRQFGPWAIITGASSGIGEEFARQLAASGIHLVLVARRLDKLNQLGEGLQKEYGIDYRCLQADLGEENAHEQVVEQTKKLDIGLLISNAGAGRPGKFLERGMDDLLNSVHLNALSHFRLAREFAGIFVKKGRGGICFVGAMGANKGIPYMAIEAGSKAFTESFAKSLNWELKDTGVHITVLQTPPTRTKAIDELGFKKGDMPTKPISVKKAVKETLYALAKNRPNVIPGKLYSTMNFLVPGKLNRSMMGTIMKRNHG